jgi:O-antigen/teichoic acid export membrane protein
MIGIGLVTSINQGVYRGLLLFKALSLLGLLSVAVKLVVGWILVSNNIAVFGALFAIFLSSLIPWAVSFKLILKYFKIPVTGSMGIGGRIFAFSIPTFAIIAASTFYLNADLLLVKHYFSPHDAGVYAAAALMGKTIFYVLSPVSVVLFSLISQRFAVKKNTNREALLSLLITVCGGICALIVFLFFPEFVVHLFFPSEGYNNTIDYIFSYGIYIFLYSIIFLLLNFFLAIEKNMAAYAGLFFSLLQIILIFLFHESLTEVINVSIFSVGLLAIVLTIMFFPQLQPLTSNEKH